MLLDIELRCPLRDSFRVRQVAGMFDLPIAEAHHHRIAARIPGLDESWQIGLIVGPSGSGKTTLARHAFGEALYTAKSWPSDRAVIDGFDESLSIKQITRVLCAVGFSTPPAWLRPYETLSTGERFRCDLARAICRVRIADQIRMRSAMRTLRDEIVAFDEFTSVVDRPIAKIVAAALSKAIRRGTIQARFIAITCHNDITEWLAPDWVLDMAGPTLKRFVRGQSSVVHCELQPTQIDNGQLTTNNGQLTITVRRCHRSLWKRFEPHHYLSNSLHPSSQCFAGYVLDRPVVFTAVLPFPHPIRPGWREHRTVCLPDFQGVGIGSAMSDYIASLFVATGKPYFSRTSHPAMIAHRVKSPLWRTHRTPRMVSKPGPASRETCCMSAAISLGRITAGFEYVGPLRLDGAQQLGILASRG